MAQSTRIYIKGTGKNQRSTASQLTFTVSTPRWIIDQTIEIYSAEDIITKTGLYGTTFYLRSTFSPHRYFPILHNESGYHCTCEIVDRECKHIKQVKRYQKAQEAQQASLVAMENVYEQLAPTKNVTCSGCHSRDFRCEDGSCYWIELAKEERAA